MAVDRVHIYYDGSIGHFTDNKSLLILAPPRWKSDGRPIRERKQIPVFVTSFTMANKEDVKVFERSIQEVIKELKERFIR